MSLRETTAPHHLLSAFPARKDDPLGRRTHTLSLSLSLSLSLARPLARGHTHTYTQAHTLSREQNSPYTTRLCYRGKAGGENMSDVNPDQLGGQTAQQASAYNKYVWWGMVLGGLYFFGPGESILQYGALIVVFMLSMLYMQQDGMLYACSHPSIPKTPEQNPLGMRSPAERGMQFEDLAIPTADGARLHGWLMRVPVRAQFAPTIVYFHGNAGNLGLRLPLFEELYFQLGCNVLAFDYRGYGKSTGKPSEEGLRRDAKAVLDYVHGEAARSGKIDPTRVLLFGRSLGGSVATWFAGTCAPKRAAKAQEQARTAAADDGGGGDRASAPSSPQHFPIRALVIENTFASIGDLAIKLFGLLRVFKFLLPFLLKSKWEAKQHIKTCQAPVMLLSAQLDQLVPPAHMNTLFGNAPDHPLTRIHRFFMGGHNDTPLRERTKYYAAFKRFLQDLDLPVVPVPRPKNTPLAQAAAAALLKATGGGGSVDATGGGDDSGAKAGADGKAGESESKSISSSAAACERGADNANAAQRPEASASAATTPATTAPPTVDVD